MSQEQAEKLGTMPNQELQLGEHGMVGKERWEQIQRWYWQERVSLSEIARRLDLDRKTVRYWIRQANWHGYERTAREDTLLSPHAQWLRERAGEVNYSAQILYQELKQRGYAGSYDTVKLFVRPLRTAASVDGLTLTRFETEPGQQSQIDWGQVSAWFRERLVILHLFVLTLGFSRRAFYYACANEQLAQFLQARSREGRDVVFCIGGPEGLAAEVDARADFKWSLSGLTLPHALARVVVAEALYRAVTIIKGHPYHRA